VQRATSRDTFGIGREPAVDDAPHAQPHGERFLLRRMGERLQRSRVVLGAHHRERLAGGVERMQVQQHLVLRQQRA
jgi:hypothetical protein